MKGDLTERFGRVIPLPGTGRLGLVSGYFKLLGVVGALGTLTIAVSLFVPGFVSRTTPWTNRLLGFVFGALMTAGFFRTSRLLDERRKTGALLAALCFAGPLIGYVTGKASSLTMIIMAGTGLALMASVWRHLD